MKVKISEILSDGYAIGRVKKIEAINREEKTETTIEIEKFEYALNQSLLQIQDIKNKNNEGKDYLIIQELMVLDPELKKKTIQLIQANNISAIIAIKYVMQEYIKGLETSTSTYLKERIVDLEDVKQRIIDNMEHSIFEYETSPHILVVDTLYPSYLIANRNLILGIIVKKGGYTSHAAILCRAWDIPFVVSDCGFQEDEEIVIDTRKNYIILSPSEEEIKEYEIETLRNLEMKKTAIPHGDFLFLANVSSNLDLPKVLEYEFDGIGLYRTEMIFMNTDRPYSFSEQYKIYQETIDRMQGRVVCFRTFDIGDDKQLPYLKAYKKGIDNYKNNPLLFIDQVKAILAANTYGNLRIMFPMIEAVEEFQYLRKWVLRIREENHYNMPKIGMMLETKTSLEHIEDFKEADFISIGTNDLTHDLYHVNRDEGIEKVDSYIEDLMKKLQRVVNFCKENDICLSVCGELASIPKVAVMFYKLGIQNLSVAPSSIRMLNTAYREYDSLRIKEK